MTTHQEATAPAWKAYKEAEAAAWKAYEEAVSAAGEAYEEARAAANDATTARANRAASVPRQETDESLDEEGES